MSDGATKSAPASACETATRASRSIVASLSTSPYAPSTPQDPWSVYWQRQTSVITGSSGARARIARTPRCTTPSSSQALEPSASLRSGRPNSSTPAQPASATRERLLGEQVGGQMALAGEPRDRAVDPLALDDEEGLDELCRVETRLADDPADRLAAAQSSEARGRKGHQSLHGKGAPPDPQSRKVRPAFLPTVDGVASLAEPHSSARSSRRRSLREPSPRGERYGSAMAPAASLAGAGARRRRRCSRSERMRSRTTPGSASRAGASCCEHGFGTDEHLDARRLARLGRPAVGRAPRLLRRLAARRRRRSRHPERRAPGCRPRALPARGSAARRRAVWSALLLLVVAVASVGELVFVRTQSFSVLCFGLLLYLLGRDDGRLDRRVLLALPLLVVWANLHAAVLVGAGVCVLYAVSCLAESRVRSRAVVARALGLAVGACVACLASPVGAELPGYLRQTVENDDFRHFVSEWQPVTLLELAALRRRPRSAPVRSRRARRSRGATGCSCGRSRSPASPPSAPSCGRRSPGWSSCRERSRPCGRSRAVAGFARWRAPSR